MNTTGSLAGFLARVTALSQPKSFFQYLPVEEYDGVQRLVLSQGGHLALHGQMGQKRLHLGRTHLCRMPLPVEQDEPSDPIDVGQLGADAVVQPPDDAADLIEQPGLAPRRGRILMSVHAVFPYGGTRAPLYNPLRLQGLASLAAAPAAI